MTRGSDDKIRSHVEMNPFSSAIPSDDLSLEERQLRQLAMIRYRLGQIGFMIAAWWVLSIVACIVWVLIWA